jgi:hypothetical protein
LEEVAPYIYENRFSVSNRRNSNTKYAKGEGFTTLRALLLMPFECLVFGYNSPQVMKPKITWMGI